VLDEARASLHVLTVSNVLFRMLLPAGDVVDSAPIESAGSIALDGAGGKVLLTTFSFLPALSSDSLLAFDALDYASRLVFETARQPGSVAAARTPRAAVVGYTGGLYFYDLETGVRRRRVLSGSDAGICGLGFSSTETEIYAVGPGGVHVLSFPDAIPAHRVYLGGSPCRLAVDPRNGRLVVPNGHGWLDVIVPSWR
jgi:hypothetical protein